MTTTDRRLLYEAFTRWCAHEHSTYFDVFSANPASPLFASMNNNNSASLMMNNSTRKDRQEQRIISGLQSAAEGRLQNYSNKINNAVSNMTSRSVTPQLSPTFSSHHHHQLVLRSRTRSAVKVCLVFGCLVGCGVHVLRIIFIKTFKHSGERNCFLGVLRQ
mgnify:CR=1 FL=1